MVTRMNADGTDLLEAARTDKVIGSFYSVYNSMGYGFLESVYSKAMVVEMMRRQLKFECEKALDVWYYGGNVGHFRPDFIVEEKVIVEIKASELLTNAHLNQLLNYLRASSIEVGLLLHFGPKPRFHRIILSKHRKVQVT